MTDLAAINAMLDSRTRKILSVGDGGLRSVPDRYKGYAVSTLDIDPETHPDYLMDAREMDQITDRFDVVCSLHNIEHFTAEDVPAVLAGMRHVLKPGGTVEVRTPDLEAIHNHQAAGGDLADVAYESPIGPITYDDILHGHQESVRGGNEYMRHLCMFTGHTLAEAMRQAGFDDIKVWRKDTFELIAMGVKPSATPSPS